MVPTYVKSALLLAGVSGLAASGMAFQDQLQWAKSRIADSPQLDPASAVALSAAITDWRSLSRPSSAPFDSYARFLLAHPGWPGEAAMKKAAERALDQGGWSPTTTVAYFRRFPPMSNAAWVRFAEALSATGAIDEARGAARTAWVGGTLSATDEAKVIAGYPDALTPADQDARMDRLLWQSATQAAARQIALVSPGRRPLFTARLAFRTNSPDAEAQAAATQAVGAGDPGYLADRAAGLANGGAVASARALLARPHAFTSQPADLDAWYSLMLRMAKGAAADGQYAVAYNIARQVDDALPAQADVALLPYDVRDAYTDLTWLAGQIAMKQLARPGDAAALFVRYAGGSRSPAIKTKGLYWAARAAETAGRRDESRGYLTKAAAYRDQFYGQLAAERLATPLLAPADPGLRPIDPAVRAAFYRREVVRAAQYLGTVGAHDDQTAFLRQIALDATSDSDHALAAELSRLLDRPDLGVMVGRSAQTNGLGDYVLAGFPMVSVPAPDAGMWTIVHAIMRQESQFDRAAVSRAGARGMMQLMPGTAREQAGKLGLAWDAGLLTASTDYNIQLGSAYFQRLYAQYGSYPLAIAAYNGGAGNVNKWLAANGDPRTGTVDWIEWIEAIPFDETRHYVQHVLENAVVYDLISPQRAMSTGAARLSWYIGNKRPG
ncbi:lytic transglycosylase domain-containing protein [uncultured Sphingomonas sp.]|uniref:lytic transglycosylase domain-containing protein n=1 Tax=uncultured Sphingomonas sp. TaxID=158754 RepID=UPI0035CC63BB